MTQLIKVALLLIVACIVRAQQAPVDCIDFTSLNPYHPTVEEYTHRIPYGSTVNLCYHVIDNSLDFYTIDVQFYDPNRKVVVIVDDSFMPLEYTGIYSFNAINLTTSMFTIHSLTPLTDNFIIIAYNNMRFNEAAIVNIKGYNAFDLDPKHLTSNNTNSVPISFGNEVKLYCQGFSDNMHVILTSSNILFDFVVLNSEITSAYLDDYSFERTILDSYVLTIHNVTSDGKYTCIDSGSPQQESFSIVGRVSSDLTVNPVHFGDRLIQASFPYGSRLNLYCHDIPSNDVEIYVIGLQVVGNSAVLEEYTDYYEFSVLNETTTVFTIKGLTSLSTSLIKCFDKKDRGCVSCSKQFIVIEGFNLLNATTKYATPFGSFDVVEPYGSEVAFYFWIFSYQNLSIIMTDKYGNTTEILDDSVISAEYSHQFCYAPSIFNYHVFTIKNVTEDLNGVQIEFVVDGVVLWTMFNITGFQVDEFEPPRCFDQIAFDNGVPFPVLVCFSSQTETEGEILYTLDINGNVTDITDKLVDVDISSDPNINAKQLIPRDNDITAGTGKVYCHVDIKLPGDYPPVRESCLFDF